MIVNWRRNSKKLNFQDSQNFNPIKFKQEKLVLEHTKQQNKTLPEQKIVEKNFNLKLQLCTQDLYHWK